MTETELRLRIRVLENELDSLKALYRAQKRILNALEIENRILHSRLSRGDNK